MAAGIRDSILGSLMNNLIWLAVITLILAAAVITAVVIAVTRRKKPEEFHRLEDELAGGNRRTSVSAGVETGEYTKGAGPADGRPLSLKNPQAGHSAQRGSRRFADDDIKTRNLFADRNIGLFSYYIELQHIKTGEKYTTGVADSVKIGRKPDCNIIIHSGTVSSYHCQIEMRGGNLVLHDLQSLNGTFVNGMRVSGAVRFSSGVILRLGQEEFLVTVCDFREHPEET